MNAQDNMPPTVVCYHPHGVFTQGYILNGSLNEELPKILGLLASEFMLMLCLSMFLFCPLPVVDFVIAAVSRPVNIREQVPRVLRWNARNGAPRGADVVVDSSS